MSPILNSLSHFNSMLINIVLECFKQYELLALDAFSLLIKYLFLT